MSQVLSEFMTWASLSTYAGCLAMVLILVQLTKNIPIFDKLPTQVWSWILAVLILLAAYFFEGKLNGSTAVLSVLNGAIVSLAANGGFEAIARMKDRDK